MTLYSNDVAEDAENTRLLYGSQIARYTRDRVIRASLDISFPQGLGRINSGGDVEEQTVEVQFRYREVGAADYIDAGTKICAGSERALVRFTHEIEFPDVGEYDVEILRLTEDNEANDVVNDCYLSAVRSFRHGDLPSHEGIAEVALRIKASDQLNGQVDSLNGTVQQLAPIWDGMSWGAPAPVRHPAWIYADALRGAHMRRPVGDSRIVLDDLKAWADDEPHWTCDYVVDTETPLREVLDIICAAGRARRALVDLNYSIIRDLAGQPVRQVYTPRNSWDFSSSISFPRDIHGFRVLVASERLEWQQDEILVFRDGYDETNATEFETLELPGVVVTKDEADQGNAWKLGRYHMATVELRPEALEWYADWEHVRTTRGDKVQLVHDVPKVGVGYGRVRAITTAAGDLVSIEIDELFDLPAGEYRVTVRDALGERHQFMATQSGNEWTWTSGVVDASAIAVDDIVAIEEMTQETLEVLITGVYPHTDESARLTGVPAAPEILNAADGVIPTYSPIISDISERYGPAAAIVFQTVTGRAVAQEERDGSLTPRIGVDLVPRGYSSEVRAIVRWRATGSQRWSLSVPQPVSATVVTGLLRDGVEYAVEVQTVDSSGRGQGFVQAGTVQARSRNFDYLAPVGFEAIEAGVDSITLQGEPYPFQDFKEFRFYGAPDTATQEVEIGTSATPRFTYHGAHRRFKVAAVDHSGAESPRTDWIAAQPRGVTTDDLADDVAQSISDAQTQAQAGLNAANQAQADANAVTDSHNALVDGFAGNLADAFASRDLTLSDLQTVVDLHSSLVAGGTSVIRDVTLAGFDATRGWSRWNMGGAVTSVPNTAYPTGISHRFVCAVTEFDGLFLRSDREIWDGAENLDHYVIEVDFTLHSGSLSGAGVRLDWDHTTGEAYTQIEFNSMQVSGEVGDVQRASAIHSRPSNYSGDFSRHEVRIFANFTSSVFTPAAKDIEFHRVLIRPATAQEIEQQQVISDLADVTADLEENYLTAVNTNNAIAAAKTEISATIGRASLIRKSDGTGGVGGWVSATANADVPAHAPAGAQSLHFADGGREAPLRAEDVAGRTFLISGWFKSNDVFRAGLRGSTDGNENGGDMIASSGAMVGPFTSWTYHEFTVAVGSASHSTHWAPGFDVVDGATDWIRAFGLRCVDVTEQTAADDVLEGYINEISGLDLNALTGTAFGTLLSELGVVAGGASAFVAETATALSNLEGDMEATVQWVAVAGGAQASFRLVATNGGSAIMLDADQTIVPGTMSVGVLSVGVGGNQFDDSRWASGADRVGTHSGNAAFLAEHNVHIRNPGQTWAGAVYPTLAIYQNGTLTGSEAIFYLNNVGDTSNTMSGEPAEAGQWWEGQLRISSHRCDGRFQLVFRGSDGTWLADASVDIQHNASGSSTNPDDWILYTVRGQAPAGTTHVQLVVRKNGTTSSTTSWLFLHKPFLGQTHADATKPTPWSPGGSVRIDGGQILADAVSLNHINLNSLAGAGFTMVGGVLQSSNFVAGVSGLYLDDTGVGEFNQLIVRESLVVGAVSDGAVYSNYATPVTRGNNTGAGAVNLGAWTANQIWHIGASVRYRHYAEQLAPWSPDDQGSAAIYHHRTVPHLQIRTLSGSTWSSWETVYSFPASGCLNTWQTETEVVSLFGEHDDVQMRLYFTTSIVGGGSHTTETTGETNTQTNVRDVNYAGLSPIH
jgi:hypothetical protein